MDCLERNVIIRFQQLTWKDEMLKNIAAILPLAGEERCCGLRPSDPRKLGKGQGGKTLQIRGKGYYCDGEVFRDRGNFEGGRGRGAGQELRRRGNGNRFFFDG